MEKWALALEGGSLRCMFSAGVVDVMMEHQLWADGVFGVSAGASDRESTMFPDRSAVPLR